jgi:hypothetical protein
VSKPIPQTSEGLRRNMSKKKMMAINLSIRNQDISKSAFECFIWIVALHIFAARKELAHLI